MNGTSPTSSMTTSSCGSGSASGSCLALGPVSGPDLGIPEILSAVLVRSQVLHRGHGLAGESPVGVHPHCSVVLVYHLNYEQWVKSLGGSRINLTLLLFLLDCRLLILGI